MLSRALVLVAFSMTAACGGASSAPESAASEHIDALEGYSLSFPAKVTTRTGREGPFVFRIDAARTQEGARFEAAWFGFPDALEAPERARLMERVVKGLASEPGTTVVSREARDGASPAGPMPGARGGAGETVDLVLDRPDGRRGFHRVLYPSPSAMLQVSAVGPPGGDWEKDVPRFYASLALDGAATKAAVAPRPAGQPDDLVLDTSRFAEGVPR